MNNFKWTQFVLLEFLRAFLISFYILPHILALFNIQNKQ